MSKTTASLLLVLGFAFLIVYAASVWVHRNDGRFREAGGSMGGAIDTRTGQLCRTVRPNEPSQAMPFCGDLH